MSVELWGPHPGTDKQSTHTLISSPEGENNGKEENQEGFTLLWDHFSGLGSCDMNPADLQCSGKTVLLASTNHKKRRVNFLKHRSLKNFSKAVSGF